MRKPRRGRSVNGKGRSTKEQRFLKLTHFMLTSIAWKSLSPLQRALFIKVAQRWNGYNNGSIGLGVREAGQALYAKAHTAGLAFKVLEDRGFLVLSKESSFDQKKLTREWRVTCFPVGPWDAPTSPPTQDYMRWRPDFEKQKPVPFGDTPSAVLGHDPPAIDAKRPPIVPLRGTKRSPHSAPHGHTSISRAADQPEANPEESLPPNRPAAEGKA